MGDGIVHRNAGDLTDAWIGKQVSIDTRTGTFTGYLSDFERGSQVVTLYMGGRTITAPPQATVTIDTGAPGEYLGGVA